MLLSSVLVPSKALMPQCYVKSVMYIPLQQVCLLQSCLLEHRLSCCCPLPLCMVYACSPRQHRQKHQQQCTTAMRLVLQTAASDSADDSGSDVATPNTVYAREVAQLFVSGRHSQFKDANSRFGSLESSRTLSSRALQAPTPSLPSSESIGRLPH